MSYVPTKSIKLAKFLKNNPEIELDEACDLISEGFIIAYSDFPYSMLPDTLKKKYLGKSQLPKAVGIEEHHFIFGISYAESNYQNDSVIVLDIIDGDESRHRLPRPIEYDISDIKLDRKSVLTFEQKHGDKNHGLDLKEQSTPQHEAASKIANFEECKLLQIAAEMYLDFVVNEEFKNFGNHGRRVEEWLRKNYPDIEQSKPLTGAFNLLTNPKGKINKKYKDINCK